MKQLRFCMVTTFYPPFSTGGDAIFVRNLSRELVARGHTVHVIHCEDSYRFLHGKDPVGGFDGSDGVNVHGLRHPARFLSPLVVHQTGRPLINGRRIRAILNTGFDVIHYHNVSLVGGTGILHLGSALKLFTLHEYWLVCPTHVLFRMQREPCVQRSCLRCALRHRRPPQLWRSGRGFRRAVARIDRFIAPSRFIERKHRELGLELNCEQLPSFVPEPIAAGRASPAQEAPYFLFVGRLERIKGVQTLIPVFARLPDARLVIVGDGSEEPRLRRAARGYPQIAFLGRRPHRELGYLYRGAVAVIVPSLCFENQPLVVLEAFASGTPVIVRDIGGLPEPVEASGGGIVYRSEEQLLAALRQLRSDPVYAVDLGRRGRRAYEQNWTPRVHVDRYLELLGRCGVG